MKRLILSSLLVFGMIVSHASASIVRPNFVGGELKTRDDRRMGMVCVSEQSSKGCSAYDVYFKERNQEGWRVLGQFKPLEKEEMLKQATQASDALISVRMIKWYFLPSGATFAACVSITKVACPAFPIVFLFDLARLPLVAATHVTLSMHNLVTSGRFLSYLKYMTNPKKQGKERLLSQLNFTAMISGLDDLPY